MWILDSVYRNGVDLWYRDDNGTLSFCHHDYDPPFFMHLPDTHAHYDMIDALEEQYHAEPCMFRTIFGELEGFSVHGGRTVAEAIERQTQFTARLFNVDIRRDQQFMAEQSIVPCNGSAISRFEPDFSPCLQQMEIRIRDDPARSPLCTDIEVVSYDRMRLQGTGKKVLSDLFLCIRKDDPDVILMSNADSWMPKFLAFSNESGIALPFSRNGRYRRMSSRSYWSYGRVEHKEAALIPDGRVLIDTDQSFVYREGGLAGVFMASRISGLPPNLAARFTPGTLISSYETYEAVKRGIVVPFRKSDAELTRKIASLRTADRGGMMFQPVAGLYEDVNEIDFTSMYPSIIVRFNLSPETVGHPEIPGFLPAVLEPVVALRKETKRMKACDPRYAGIDTLLKWMLVTCFGYTGYKNAKFGRIEVHEAITARSREILLRTKDLAESMGFSVLHGIVDCLWVQGPDIGELQDRICIATGLSAENEHFDWIVFLPLNDGFGAYNRYYGRLSDGSIKVRGIAARRHDTPEYIRRMQQEMLEVMRSARTAGELEPHHDRLAGIYAAALDGLPAADPGSLAICRRISRTRYARRCLEGAAMQAYRHAGVDIAPGMQVRYVVRDAKRYLVDPEWAAGQVDPAYYRGLVMKAWQEIDYAFIRGNAGTSGNFMPGAETVAEGCCCNDDPARI